MAEETYDIIIIGGGIMGSCAAYESSKRGKTVLLLERFDLLHHLGSSHGESRTFRATYPSPQYPPMVIESARLWEESQAESGLRVLTQTTQLVLAHSHNPALRSVVRNCAAHSIPHALYDSDPLLSQQFSGAFRLPPDWLAVSTTLAGVIKPTKAVSMFQSLATRRGAVLRDRAEIAAVSRDASGLISVSTADDRRFLGRKCVVTAGAWTRKLVAAIAGKELPIQPLHTLIWYWKIREGYEEALSAAGGFPTFAFYGEPAAYGTPSIEFPGLMKVSWDSGWPCDPDRRDWTVDGADEARRVGDWIEAVMPGRIETGLGPVMTQPCMYSMTPDEDYIIDFVGGEFGKDVVVAGGFSGHGFKMGPLVGRILAEMAIDGEAGTAARIGVDMRLFGIDRFEEDPRGNARVHELF